MAPHPTAAQLLRTNAMGIDSCAHHLPHMSHNMHLTTHAVPPHVIRTLDPRPALLLSSPLPSVARLTLRALSAAATAPGFISVTNNNIVAPLCCLISAQFIGIAAAARMTYEHHFRVVILPILLARRCFASWGAWPASGTRAFLAQRILLTHYRPQAFLVLAVTGLAMRTLITHGPTPVCTLAFMRLYLAILRQRRKTHPRRRPNRSFTSLFATAFLLPIVTIVSFLAALLLLRSINLAALLNPGPAQGPLPTPSARVPFRLQTWNTRGGIAPHLDEASALLAHGDSPDCTIFTETRLSKSQTRHDHLRAALQGSRTARAKLCFSSLPDSVPHSARRGVCAVVSPRWAACCTQRLTPPALEGSAISLDFRYSVHGAIFLRVVGIYGSSGGRDVALTEALHEFIAHEALACKTSQKTNQTGYHLVVIGDFNAVYCDTDRSSRCVYPHDLALQSLAHKHKLTPVPCIGARVHTFTKDPTETDPATRSSRIDDAYIMPHTRTLVLPELTQVLTSFPHSTPLSVVPSTLALSARGHHPRLLPSPRHLPQRRGSAPR